MKEIDLKRWVLREWQGWSSSYEPRQGGTVGIADLQIVCNGHLIPVELKVGKVALGQLTVEKIRPAQVQWHQNLSQYGVGSIFLVGCGSHGAKEPTRLFVFLGSHVSDFLQTTSVKAAFELDTKRFNKSLKTFLTNSHV